MRRPPRLFCALLLPVLLAACGEASASKTVGSQEPRSDSNASPEEKATQGRILQSGFGQAKGDQYVWVTALVKSLSDHGGQTVTVSFNLLDDAGQVVATESQVESFNVAGQVLAVGTQVDVGPQVNVAAVEPTLLVEDNAAFPETDQDLGTYPAKSIAADQYSKSMWHAKFTIENPTSEPLQSPRIGIVCKGSDGKINGGGSEYPELVPPSGQVVIDPNLILSGKPKECTAYVAAGM